MIEVLIVEDDPMVARVNRDFANSVAGFQVVGIAGTAEEGLSKIIALQPDLALIDVYLPDQSGLELLRELRKLQVPSDAILITAAHDAETVENAFRYGAVDYILKPFKLRRLQLSLETYASMRTRLNSMLSLSQQEIDQLKAQHLNILEEEKIGQMPKGLNDLTMKQVLLHMIKNSQPLSAEEVAEGLGLARVTARRYLEYLDETGKVIVDLQYGSVGRPVKKYKLL